MENREDSKYPTSPMLGGSVQVDALKDCIEKMMKLMVVDFGRRYGSLFESSLPIDDKEHPLRLYKRRLYSVMRGKPIDCIKAAYTDYVKSGNEWPPEIPVLLAKVIELEKVEKQHEKNRLEKERLLSLPEPELIITCDPVQMLSEAKAKNKHDHRDGRTPEDHESYMREALKAHNALLIIHSRHIKQSYASPDHLCEYGACNNSGTISGSTSGGGNYYCAKHYRMLSAM